MSKEILFSTEKIINGIDKLTDAVKITMGPLGRTVIIEKAYGAPVATKDGVSVAREITLSDSAENIGAKLVIEAAKKAGDKAGDGTTTATLLTQKIIHFGRNAIGAGSNPTLIKRGIDMAVSAVISDLESHSQKISGDNEIAQVATISANGDSELGQQIASAIKRVGREGVITVEEARGLETEIDAVLGMQFDNGFMSPYFITDSEKMLAELENPYILVSEKKITNLQSLLPILEPVAGSGRPLMIIAEDIESDALATLVLNRLRGGLKVCAARAPGFGDRRKEMLQDIAILTGATLVSDDLGMKLEDLNLEVLGTAKRVVSSKENTLIVDGGGDVSAIKKRADEIRMTMEKTSSEYDREKLSERLAKLVGGIAVIRVGGMTAVEVKEKKDRVDDAVAATKAALADGIVPGGGVALVRAMNSIVLSDTRDVATGQKIVVDAISEPLKQIMENAGMDSDKILKTVAENTDYNFGYNVATETYGDMIKMGVIDPALVVKIALQSASSVAAQILMTGAVLVDIPDPKPSVEK